MSNEIPTVNHSIPISAYLIGQVHWLRQIRSETNNKSKITGINLSITILLCTYIESAFNEILGAVLKKRIKETDDLTYKKLLKSMEDRLSKATWTQYNEIGNVILPQSLIHYSDNETWKGISVLFKLRNQLVHGKDVKAILLLKDDELELKYLGVFDKIFEYFKEQRVIKPNQVKSTTHKILSIRTTDHFIQITDKFIDQLLFRIYDELEIDNFGIFLGFKMNIKNDFGVVVKEEAKHKRNIKESSDELPF